MVCGAALALALVASSARPAAASTPSDQSPATAACVDKGKAAVSTVRTLILDWTGDDTLMATRGTWAQLVAMVAVRVPGLEVLTSGDLRAAIALEADKQLLGCDEGASCLAEIAEALDATLVVQGELTRSADGAVTMGMSLINAHAMVVVNRVTFTWRGASDALPDLARAGAQLLLVDKGQRPPGSILVQGLPPDAQVFLDDVDVTVRLAEGPLMGVDVGPHTLRVRAPGKLPATLPVVILSGQRAVALPVLEDEPAGLAWVLAGGVGVVAVGLGVTLGLMWAMSSEEVTVSGTATLKASAVNGVGP